MRSHCRLPALLAALVLMPAAEAGTTIYKWVDEAGVTHYAQQPPPGQETQRLETRLTNSTTASPPRASQPASGDHANGDGADDGFPDNVNEYCEQMRQQAATLAGDARVTMREDDGSLTPLEGEARAERLAQAREQIARHCGDDTG